MIMIMFIISLFLIILFRAGLKNCLTFALARFEDRFETLLRLP